MKRRNKYRVPHQSAKECARRLRQIAFAQLWGGVRERRGRPASAFISDAARYAAHGLIAPDGLALVQLR
jgi:hypothetical protein